MLYTLMPQAERAILSREYRFRVAVVFLVMASIAVVGGAIFLLPAYLRARSAEQSALSSVSSVGEASGEGSVDQASQALSSAASLVSILSQGSGEHSFSDVIGSVAAVRSSVVVSSLSLDRAADGSTDITIQGTAPTRDDLLAFKSQLEALSPGASVNLPIDELAKDSDIQFSLQLSLYKP